MRKDTLARIMSNQWQLSDEHQYLLRATLCSGEEVARAWHEWRQRADFENLDLASYRLLPMLYGNLKANPVTDPLLPRLAGVYKRTWVENQLLYERIDTACTQLMAAQIQPLLLGEAAMDRNAEFGSGLRPLKHAIVGIENSDLQAAKTILFDLGWRQRNRPRAVIKRFATHLIRQTAHFIDSEGHTFRLTWQPLAQYTNGASESISQSAHSHTRVSVLRPEAQLKFLLRNRQSTRAHNKLVFLSDLYYLTQLVSHHPFSDQPAVRMLDDVVGLTDVSNAETGNFMDARPVDARPVATRKQYA